MKTKKIILVLGLFLAVAGVGKSQIVDFNYSFNNGQCVPVIVDFQTGLGFGVTAVDWDFGDGSPHATVVPEHVCGVQHAYTLPGAYTVTLTVWWGATSSSASKTIVITNGTPDTVPISAHICQGGVYDFFGLSLATAGVYYGTVRNTLGCDSIMYELTLTVDTLPCNATIEVAVARYDTACLSSALVELYSVQSGVCVLIDTATITNHGRCSFANVAGGSYIIKAVPDGSENALPTYYGNTEFWNKATIVNIAYDTFYLAYIQLLPLPSIPIGNSSISGYVVKGEGYKSLSQKSVDKPAEDVNVYLQKEENSDWHTIAHTLTDEEGYFVFKNIPAGKYQVILDIPCLEMLEIQIIVIENDGDNVQLEDYELTEDGIKIKETLGINNYELRITNYVVFPNPTTGKLKITNYGLAPLTDQNRTLSVVEVYDVAGQVVFTSPVFAPSPETTIDISHLANGMYFLKIGGKTIKMVKQ